MKNIYIFLAIVAFITAIFMLIGKEYSDGAIWVGLGFLFLVTYSNAKK